MNNKIKIAHVLNYLGIGGLELGVVRQSILLSEHRFDVTLICFQWHPDTLPPIPDHIKLIKLDSKPGFDLNLILQLRTILKEHHIDIVHSHNWGTFVYSVLAAKLAGVPVVFHGEHGRDTESYLFSKKRAFLNRMLFSLCDKMTTVSRDIAGDWRKENVLLPWKILTVENGVDLDRFRHDLDKIECRKSLGLPPGKKIIGTIIGQIRPVKDVNTLILAFHKLLVSRRDLHLAVVGYDDDAIESLQEFIQALGIKDFITFLGMQKDVRHVLHAYDIYVNSSIYEGMSNTLLEAMTMSRPVVATRVGGTPFIIRDGWNGLLVPSKAPEDLANAIARILNEKKLEERLAANGRKAIETRHNIRQTVYSYAHVYSSSYSDVSKKSNPLKTMAKNAALKTVSPFVNIKKQRMKSGLHILTTHQVVPFDQWYEILQPNQAIPLETFEDEVLFLLENAKPVGLPEITDRLASKNGFNEPVFSITFDDGYKDVYDYAFPFLQKHNVPFFIFIVGTPFSENHGIWCNNVFKYVHALFHQDAEGWINFIKSHDWFFAKNGFQESLDINHLLKELLRDLNYQDAQFRAKFCDDLQRRVDGLLLSSDMTLATEQDIRDMLDSGLLAVGSHSMTHLYLDSLAPDVLEYEIRASKELLEDKLNREVTSLAYPWGRYNGDCLKLCEKHGYDMAFTTVEGSNNERTNPYALKRKDAGYLAQDLMFSRPKALVEMNGMMDLLHTD